MCDIDPTRYVQALRILVDASSEPSGPSFDEASLLVKHLDVPEDWLKALTNGWADYAKRYKRPWAKELVSKRTIRFLRPGMLRVYKRSDADRKCVLCGLEVQKPAICWHKQCWAALEKEAQQGWDKLCRQAIQNCNFKCESCECELRRSRRERKASKFQFDHIVPLCLEGQNSANNIQVLCIACHKIKTKKDVAELAKRRRLAKEVINEESSSVTNKTIKSS